MSACRIFGGLVAVLWLAASALSAEVKPPDPWRDFDLAEVRVEGILLRYEKRLTPKMDGIRAAVADFAKKEAKHFAKAKELRDKSAKIIEQINAIVGLSPSAEQKAEQRKLFFGLLDAGAVVRLTGPGRKSTLYLITRKSSKDYLRKGGKLPGFTYDKAKDQAEYRFHIGRTSRDKGAPKQVELVLPIDADKAGERISDILSGMSRTWGRAWVGLAVHELVESTILWYRLKPRDPYFRWFSDGFANAVAIHVLRSNVGEKAAVEFAEMYGIARHAALAKKINLQYWLAVNQCIFKGPSGPLDSESDLTQARYSFAMHEAVRLIDKHGIGCVAKILDKACAPNRGASREDILAAVKEATGEDIAKRLGRYQSFKTRQEGLAMYTKRYQGATARKDHHEALTALLRMHELRERRDLAVFAQVAELLFKLGHKAAGRRVLTRAQLRRKETVKRLLRAAQGGDPNAMVRMGEFYRQGIGVEKDLAEAVKWLRKATETGQPEAMFNLGLMYHNGEGVKRDLAKAVEWYRKAAEAGGAAGMNRMGLWYAEGKYVEKDLTEAAKWFRKSAEAGFVPAMYNLADAYERGLGVEKDVAEAAKWSKAAEARKEGARSP